VVEWLAAGIKFGAPTGEVVERLRTRVLAKTALEALDQHAISLLRAEAGWWRSEPKAELKMLSADREAGTFSFMVRFGADYLDTGRPHAHPVDEEFLVLDGELWLGDKHLERGDYLLIRRGTVHGPVRCEGGATVYIRSAFPPSLKRLLGSETEA
jgi:hypothetical protein